MEHFCRRISTVLLDVLVFVQCTIRLQLSLGWWRMVTHPPPSNRPTPLPIIDSPPNEVLFNQTTFTKQYSSHRFNIYTCIKNFIMILPYRICIFASFLSKLFPKLWFSWLKQSCGHERPVFEFLWALVTLWWRGFVRSASHSCRFLTLKCYHSRPDCLIGSMACLCW